jgi:hypothetical protein
MSSPGKKDAPNVSMGVDSAVVSVSGDAARGLRSTARSTFDLYEVFLDNRFPGVIDGLERAIVDMVVLSEEG